LDPEGWPPGGHSLLSDNFDITSDGSMVLMGGTADLGASYDFVSDGKSKDAAPDFAGVNVGYLNYLNPTLVSVDVFVNLDVTFRVDGYVSVDYEFTWRTGRQRAYWYRIVGKAKADDCPPIDMNDDCCRQYVMNVHARSLPELCTKLRERQWKWPIDVIQRFSRPAETIAVEEDRAAGLNVECNVAEVVEICKIPECFEFCLDYDITLDVGVIAEAIHVAAHDYVSLGDQITMGGNAVNTYTRYAVELEFESDGESITMSGAGVFSVSNFDGDSSGGIVMSGDVVITASDYSFVGGQYPWHSPTMVAKSFTQFQRVESDEDWLLTDRLAVSDNLHASCDISYLHASKLLVCRNLGFVIPAGVRIVGVVATVERHATIQARDDEVYLLLGEELLSDNLADTSVMWPVGVDAVKTYGAVLNNWRNPALSTYLGDWDVNDLNDPDFGIGIRVKPLTNAVGARARIDQITLTVFYEDPINQCVRVSGESGFISSIYNHVASGSVQIDTGRSYALSVSRNFVSTGKGEFGPDYAAVKIVGGYEVHLDVESSGGITMSGDAFCLPSHYDCVADGSVVVDGESLFVSPVWNYQSGGGGPILSTANVVQFNPNFITSGQVSMSGTADLAFDLVTQSSGQVTMGGEVATESSNYNYVGTGTITIGSEGAGIDFQGLGDFEVLYGVEAVADYEEYVFSIPEIEDIEVPTTTVSECSCVGMTLSLSFMQNLTTNNLLSQFLTRNTLSVPRVLKLVYNKINDSWQTNLHYKGFSGNTTTRESWDLVFELQCIDSIGGEFIGRKIWRFSANIVRKNLTTLEDYDTKLLVGFFPDGVCRTDTFRATIMAETQAGYVVVDPTSTIHHYVLYDNIGLFKNSYWTLNPELSFSISQVPFADPVVRVNPHVGV
jgi:hypothetical protein